MKSVTIILTETGALFNAFNASSTVDRAGPLRDNPAWPTLSHPVRDP